MRKQEGGEISLTRLLPGGIRPRLFLLVALMVLPLMGLLGWISWEHYDLRKLHALRTETEVAAGVATTFAAYVEGMHHECKAIGEAVITDGTNPAWIRRFLTIESYSSPTVRNFTWADMDGTVVASSDPRLEGQGFSGRPFFRELLESNREYIIGNLTSSGLVSDRPTVVIAVRIKDIDGRSAGIVVAGIEPSRFGEVTLVQKRQEGGGRLP